MSEFDELESVSCDICGEEVNDPALDWCIVCERKLCDDCIAATDREHGVNWCQECYERDQADMESEGGGGHRR